MIVNKYTFKFVKLFYRRGTCFKLKKGTFRLDIRNFFFFFFTVRVVKHQNRVHSGVDAPSLETFKAKLEEALRNLF